MKNKKPKVIVAMSGGVDSAVAAKLLKDQGYNVLGVFLYFWKDSKEEEGIASKAYLDASRICQKLGIRLYTLNFSREFKKEVVLNFLKEYACGRTPNPCIRCNRFIKFGLLIKKAKALGYDYVATGHYARIKRKTQEYKLLRGRDKKKDQSYFLYTLTQKQLSCLLFPLGNYTKEKIRKIAEKAQLAVANKKDSQEICFIPEKNHKEFLKRHLKIKSGPIKTYDGRVLGKHDGLPLYTVGQRKGVEIGGIGPFYVVRADYQTNTLYVVKDGNDPLLYQDKLIAQDVNWLAGEKPKLSLKCEAVIRYGHKAVKCEISLLTSLLNKQTGQARKEDKKEKYLVEFSKPLRAITAGQSIVFYKKDEVWGGGVIKPLNT